MTHSSSSTEPVTSKLGPTELDPTEPAPTRPASTLDAAVSTESLKGSVMASVQQLKQRYPESSLVAEFITYAANEYAVRAVVQVGDRILSTGMAASPNLEQAEDRAKIRAIATLGFEGDRFSASSQDITPSTGIHPLNPQPAITDSLSPDTPRLKPAKPIKSPRRSSAADAPAKSAPNNQHRPITQPSVPDAPIVQPMDRSVAPPNPEIQDTHVTPSSRIPDTPLQPPLADGPELLSLAPEPAVPSDSSDSPVSFIPPPETEEPPFLDLETEAKENPAPPVQPGAPSENAQPEQVRTALDSSSNVNLVDAIAKTSVEMQRLGWDVHQGREHLLVAYGKRSRGELTDDELLDFLQFLEKQTTPDVHP